jgi:nitroreductase
MLPPNGTSPPVARPVIAVVVAVGRVLLVILVGMRGREFYSIIDGAFVSMIILLSAVNEGMGAAFVGAFEDDKVSQILELPKHVKPVGIICLGYPAETPEKLSRI